MRIIKAALNGWIATRLRNTTIEIIAYQSDIACYSRCWSCGWSGNDAVHTYGREHGIATEAWSPIAQGGVMDDPMITAIAERIDRTPAQVVLRWHIERGNIVFPKSTTPSRIEENFAIFDFTLDAEDMAAIAALDRVKGSDRPQSRHLRLIPEK